MPLFSRSFRSLIQRQRGVQWHIKVLQTLGCSALQAAIDIKVFQTLGMARDRPSPYGEGMAFFTVARGPVPRDRWIARARTMARETRSHARVACEGPSPTMKGRRFFTVTEACHRDVERINHETPK